ncbi:MAG: CPBP family intramembrane metalloprotease [Dehalococcoidia bacterium]|nr:CPBP family intramembrane metalloprotease [Dehalococcoidia bacterium]
MRCSRRSPRWPWRSKPRRRASACHSTSSSQPEPSLAERGHDVQSVREVGKGLGAAVGLVLLVLAALLLVHCLWPAQLLPAALGATALVEAGLLWAAWCFGTRSFGAWRAMGLRLPSNPLAYSALPALVLFASLLATLLYTQAVTLVGLDGLRPTTPTQLLQLEGPLLWVGGFIIVGLGPLAEEIFFRGFLLRGLAPRLGGAGAAIVSSLIFAIAHLTPGVLAPIFILGLLLSWLYLKTRSIVPGLIAHSAQNALALLALTWSVNPL